MSPASYQTAPPRPGIVAAHDAQGQHDLPLIPRDASRNVSRRVAPYRGGYAWLAARIIRIRLFGA
jgi:hypothetical protein